MSRGWRITDCSGKILSQDVFFFLREKQNKTLVVYYLHSEKKPCIKGFLNNILMHSAATTPSPLHPLATQPRWICWNYETLQHTSNFVQIFMKNHTPSLIGFTTFCHPELMLEPECLNVLCIGQNTFCWCLICCNLLVKYWISKIRCCARDFTPSFDLMYRNTGLAKSIHHPLPQTYLWPILNFTDKVFEHISLKLLLNNQSSYIWIV